ncbi:MAG: hypothetical protein IKT56_00290 [Clostridia bacterium]|nr:hypothetical protein [Clostridia bacterium]
MRTRYIPKSEREKNALPSTKKRQSSCEDCEYYDYDEYTDSYYCKMSLDEDEMISFLSGNRSSCPYYKYYDEYKSVNKQI